MDSFWLTAIVLTYPVFGVITIGSAIRGGVFKDETESSAVGIAAMILIIWPLLWFGIAAMWVADLLSGRVHSVGSFLIKLSEKAERE